MPTKGGPAESDDLGRIALALSGVALWRRRPTARRLVILAAEWGNGRRQGWLSNLHLGARIPETNTWAMLGKTFKGMTDDMLRALAKKGGVVHINYYNGFLDGDYDAREKALKVPSLFAIPQTEVRQE